MPRSFEPLNELNLPGYAERLKLWLQRWIGLDAAIVFTILTRFWQALSGLVTLFLIAHFLSASQQGYYYTFYSIVALQIVFELGFSFVILQLAAHERAQLSFLPDGMIVGDVVSLSRLASILQKAVYWYMGAGVLMAAMLVPAGLWFFSAHTAAGSSESWKAPWILLVVAAMLAFQIDPVFSFLEGCGFIVQVAKRRFTQAIVGSALAWPAMMLHRGLFAPALLILGQVAVGLVYLLGRRHRKLLGNLLRYPVREHFVGWRKEILPFQWRIALSWLCGYFIYQVFNPVLFVYQGPVAAGRMGMSLSLASGIGSIALAWMNTKASPFGVLVARGEIAQLDSLFFRTLRQSTILLSLGCVSFLAGVVLAGSRFESFTERLLPVWALALLLFNTIINHVVCSLALYLRAHKEEPFLIQAVISAILIVALTITLGRYYGVNMLVIGLFVQATAFGLPSGIYLFVTKRKLWHSDKSAVRASEVASVSE